MDHLKYFSSCFQDLLAENNLSLKQFSALTGTKLSRLYDFINQKHIPSLANAIKIADVFQCQLDYLFGFIKDYQATSFKITDSASNRIKLAMSQSKHSRYQLSKITKISQSQLLRWYHGKQVPTLVSIIALVEPLNFSLDYLCGRD